ncbi:hypothetical protein [Streptomyces fuscichromogenes]|uniref:Uncharacterized protein n=1 Tax=Streptomyces fuscichromogenes TaxID=1324013 RepID=A0A917XIF8_9ACTN|nr:hypothetical protein [Streptomyces fuscichromogenes]GGN28629.1 hypothetical protein GCM10011578_064810 [Streptomyces fuscichromogenes]
MPEEYNARIKALSVVRKGTSFTVDVLGVNDDFDVVADIEVGASFNAVSSRIQVWASVGNQTQLVQVQVQGYDQPAIPVNGTRAEPIRIPFNALDATKVTEGDLLQAVATLKVIAGALSDVSHARSEPFVYAS